MTRVLYAIENGGFSGAIMPQNVVVGQQALEVARFVATYAGRGAPKVPGVPSCQQKDIGTIPALTPAGTAAATKTAKQASKVNARASGKVRTGKPGGTSQTGKSTGAALTRKPKAKRP